MKLEDLTKDELIYCIKRRTLFIQEPLEYDVLRCRQEKVWVKYEENSEKSTNALNRYIEIAKKHEGKPLIKIPDADINSMAAALSEHEKYSKLSERYYKEYERYGKRIDEALEVEE